MSLPLLSANAFQDLLDLAEADDPVDEHRVHQHRVHEHRAGETGAVGGSLEEQYFVEWQVPQAS